jgi:ferredoxin
MDNCKFGAMQYRPFWKKKSSADKAGNPETSGTAPADAGRRAFITSSVIAAGALTLKAQEKKVDGGYAAVTGKKAPERTSPIVPFGAGGEKNFYSHCTGCQLCVSQCPNNVLRPSSSLEHLMQPEMSYEKGWCRIECTKCSEVCPAGAILAVKPEEKTSIHIGLASVDLDLCVVNRDGVSCGNCARHCPAGAIMMVRKDPSDENSLRIPTVNESRCIGCGACEYLCPSRPFSAIHVNGLKSHRND